MDKLVLDTNVLIDGIKDENSAAWQIINAVFERKVELYVSHPVVREYRRILQREISDPAYSERVLGLLDLAIKIDVHNIQRLVVDDPEDDKVIATALTAGADALISEDKHLLDLDKQYDLRIMKPKEYLNRNQQDSSWSDFAKLIGLN
ncbi:MAG: putative toxin-antitoxin system toxin component, PIN family [bacterium]|nr:putative toxin-antitoxin system toxin component, PIN family [bacterium]